MSLAAFYWECVKRAFKGKFGIAERPLAVLAVVALLVAVFTPLGDDANEWLNLRLPAYLFLGVYGGLVIFGLVRAPYEIYRESQSKLLDLEGTLTPRLELYLGEGAGLTNVHLVANTSFTQGGHRSTAYLASEDIVCILCRNVSSFRVANVEVRLLAARRLDNGSVADLGIVEAIQLSWSRMAKPFVATTVFDPGETKRVYIAASRQKGSLVLYRDFKELPGEYHRLFTEAGRYQLDISVSGDGVPNVRATLEVETFDDPQPANKLPSGRATLSLVNA